MGSIPIDGTLLTTLDAGLNPLNNYVVYGGAKFEIPGSLSDVDVLSELGYLADRFRSVPGATISQIPDVPQDGTVLKEIHARDPYLIMSGTKQKIVGARRFFDLGLFWPDVGILWDGALDAFPDGQLA
jgi:hypothetical protein